MIKIIVEKFTLLGKLWKGRYIDEYQPKHKAIKTKKVVVWRLSSELIIVHMQKKQTKFTNSWVPDKMETDSSLKFLIFFALILVLCSVVRPRVKKKLHVSDQNYKACISLVCIIDNKEARWIKFHASFSAVKYSAIITIMLIPFIIPQFKRTTKQSNHEKSVLYEVS